MNCFVVMPYGVEFDDVYAALRTGVEGAIGGRGGRCFRLDESRPAGRITERLVRELGAASFCLADLTGTKPNVMWEVGYAMALGKPTIIVTQDSKELPFDLHDMQCLAYDRSRLRQTLTLPLGQVVRDTVAHIEAAPVQAASASRGQDEVVGRLLAEVQQLKIMVAESVQMATASSKRSAPSEPSPKHLEGAWLGPRSGSHYYARFVNGELVVPYCYTANDELTGVFFDWQLLGEYWFSRFQWLPEGASGFAFLKEESANALVGSYWHDHQVQPRPTAPPSRDGVALRWERQKASFPKWATGFLTEVQRHGLRHSLPSR